MPSFEEAQELIKSDIGGVPVWAIVGGGAVALFALSKLVGGSSPGETGDSSTPVSPGLTRDEFTELSGQQFGSLSSDVNTRFADINALVASGQAESKAAFGDFTTGLAKANAANQSAFASLATGQKSTTDAVTAASTSQSASIKALSGQVTQLTAKVDALSAAETRRDERHGTQLQSILDILRKLPGGGTKQPVEQPRPEQPKTVKSAPGQGGHSFFGPDPYRALSRTAFDPRREAA